MFNVVCINQNTFIHIDINILLINELGPWSDELASISIGLHFNTCACHSYNAILSVTQVNGKQLN
jgi:hypothetical protein